MRAGPVDKFLGTESSWSVGRSPVITHRRYIQRRLIDDALIAFVRGSATEIKRVRTRLWRCRRRRISCQRRSLSSRLFMIATQLHL